MRPLHALALLVLLFAALVGCAKKRAGEDGPASDSDNGFGKPRGGGPVRLGRQPEQPPPWPPLPEVPPRPKSFPETPGGRIAWGLDAAAESLVVHGSPAKETHDRWELYSFRRAFSEAEPEIKRFPRARVKDQ